MLLSSLFVNLAAGSSACAFETGGGPEPFSLML